MPRPKAVTAWSYSRWSGWDTCPLQFKLRTIDKLPEPPSPAMTRGGDIHTMAEDWVAAPKKLPLPEELDSFPDEFIALRALRRKKKAAIFKEAGPMVEVEMEWSFTDEWERTAWFGPDAWCRIKVDVFVFDKVLPRCIDHKTGKIREAHIEQMGLYALGAFKRYPMIEAVQSELWYLDAGVEKTLVFNRVDHEVKLQKKWEKRAAGLMSDRRFVPRQSPICRWCNFSASKGGQCEFG